MNSSFAMFNLYSAFNIYEFLSSLNLQSAYLDIKNSVVIFARFDKYILMVREYKERCNKKIKEYRKLCYIVVNLLKNMR